MSVRHGKVASGGRLRVPAEFRHALGLSDGDIVAMEVSDNALHVRPITSALRQIQQELRPYAAGAGSVADELIAERRLQRRGPILVIPANGEKISALEADAALNAVRERDRDN
jgi:bifunctional DNA-binding transcriptional regulator/antitoxin component of YhaV-PrlF toxin-antitoxin module